MSEMTENDNLRLRLARAEIQNADLLVEIEERRHSDRVATKG